MTLLTTDHPPFEFKAYPNPPLTFQASLLVVGAFALVCAGMAAGLVVAGAWPATPFLGLDVLGLALAFWWMRRSARSFEHITIAGDHITVRSQTAGGRVSLWQARSYWCRVALSPARRGGAGALALAEGQARCEIGRCLTYPEKRALAQAIGEALGKVRRTPD